MKPTLFKLKNGQTVTIRDARVTDAPYSRITLKTMAGESIYLSGGPAENDRTLKEEEEFIQLHQDHPHALMIVVEQDRKILGFLSFAPSDKQRMAHWGEFGVAILKEYWGNGLGQFLLQIMIDWARENPGVERIMLNVHSGNTRGIHLYKKYGFVEEGRQVKALKFKNGEYMDNILMAMWVGPE